MPNKRFCSTVCKEQARADAKRADVEQRRSGRSCRTCAGPIPPTRSSKALTCSEACAERWFNEHKQEAKRDTWQREKPPCAHCGKDIPPHRRRGVLYCSDACRRAQMGTRWRRSRPFYIKGWKYGISPERYAEMLAEQGDRCAICGTDTPAGKGGWHTDHDHATNRVRGLLCHHCNLLLGHAKDDPAILRAAVDYLMR